MADKDLISDEILDRMLARMVIPTPPPTLEHRLLGNIRNSPVIIRLLPRNMAFLLLVGLVLGIAVGHSPLKIQDDRAFGGNPYTTNASAMLSQIFYTL